MVLSIITALYIICALLLTLYALGSAIMLFAYFRHHDDAPPRPPLKDHPSVAVQLPLYNELYVVERLLDAVAALDYPREKLSVQVLDDSTDETVGVAADSIARLRASGLNIVHVRRGSREGYKAGALAYGLAQSDAEFVAVLDADFVPPPDFLTRIMPHFANDNIGMVQARWGHLNDGDNLLTRGQSLALDGHFVVEQTARNRSGWLMNFNGTGGVWRAAAIRDAGGWQDTTLTEDLDLSYRAQLKGWRFLYLPDLVVPGELPLQMTAYKQQQARWAKGGTQCMAMLIRPIWTSERLSLMQRVMATLHLCQYLVHPLIVLMLLLTPFLLVTHQMEHLPLGPLGIVGIAPPLIYIVSQHALYADWRRRILALPALVALGTGMAWNNARAVVSGLLGQREEFKRTPKYARQRTGNKYALKLHPSILVEVFFSAYALMGAALAVNSAPTLLPYLLLYAIAFAMVAVWGVRDYLELRHAQRQP